MARKRQEFEVQVCVEINRGNWAVEANASATFFPKLPAEGGHPAMPEEMRLDDVRDNNGNQLTLTPREEALVEDALFEEAARQQDVFEEEVEDDAEEGELDFDE